VSPLLPSKGSKKHLLGHISSFECCNFAKKNCVVCVLGCGCGVGGLGWGVLLRCVVGCGVGGVGVGCVAVAWGCGVGSVVDVGVGVWCRGVVLGVGCGYVVGCGVWGVWWCGVCVV
jgi:hypothetical protein